MPQNDLCAEFLQRFSCASRLPRLPCPHPHEEKGIDRAMGKCQDSGWRDPCIGSGNFRYEKAPLMTWSQEKIQLLAIIAT